MNKSDSIKNIAAALQLFHLKMGKVSKSANNPFFKSKYAPLPDILEAIADPLDESGLTFSQFPDGDSLTTILMHPESGEWIEASYSMHPVKSDPQSVGSAITYARRYALGAILALNIDEDDDGNKASAPAAKPLNENFEGSYGTKTPKATTPPPPPPPASDNRPWLNENTDEFNRIKAALAKVEDKAGALKAFETRFKISKQTKEKLIS
jgi:hypothetical protein